MLPALTAYTVFQRKVSEGAEASGSAAVEDEVAYWREAAGTISSAEELVDDPRLFAFITTAFGYGETPPSTGLVELALGQGAADTDDFVNRSPDHRLEQMARQFGFAEFGTARLSEPYFIDAMASRYRREAARLESFALPTQSAQTPAEIETEYFRTRIGSIASAEELVDDFRLYQVAVRAFGLEDDFGNNPFLIEQVLRDGVTDDTDIANQIGDERLIALARSFGFGEVGTTYVSDPAFGENIERRYLSAVGELTTTGGDEESDDSAYFRDVIGDIETLDDLLTDQRLYTYVLTAFDLSSETDKPAIVRAVLEEGASDDGALAIRLSDPRWITLAQTLAVNEFGMRNLNDPDFINEIVDRFERVNAEIEAGEEDPIVELAAYFDRRASSLTNWLFVTADSRLRDVAATALGLPDAVLGLDTDRLISEFEARFDIEDFQDPERRAQFVQRYIALAEINAGGFGSSAGSAAVSILAGAVSASSLYSTVSGL